MPPLLPHLSRLCRDLLIYMNYMSSKSVLSEKWLGARFKEFPAASWSPANWPDYLAVAQGELSERGRIGQSRENSGRTRLPSLFCGPWAKPEWAQGLRNTKYINPFGIRQKKKMMNLEIMSHVGTYIVEQNRALSLEGISHLSSFWEHCALLT